MSISTYRTTLIKRNILASFVLKGWSAIVVLLLVPITLKMLGIYSNGVWLTISSVIVWIDLMDFGLGNGLRNAVTTYIAEGNHEKVREAVSSTFLMLTGIALPLLLTLYVAIWQLDIYKFFGVDSLRIGDFATILTATVTLISGTFILKATGNFYMGLQLPAINNLIICFGQTTVLILTFFAYSLGCHSLLIVALISTGAPLGVWLISMAYTFGIKYPQYRPSMSYFNIHLAKDLCSKGIQFFVIQICGVILFMSTNIIISQMFSPAEVTPYQIGYRYFTLVLVVFSTICMPFWNATTDAYARNDIQWIRQAGHKLNLLLVGCFLALAMMVLLSNYVYRIWVGNEVVIPIHLSASLALYVFIQILSLRYSYILNGLNILRIQLLFIVPATIAFLPLAWYACNTFSSVTSLVLTMCIVNTPGLIANAWKYYQIINTYSNIENNERLQDSHSHGNV